MSRRNDLGSFYQDVYRALSYAPPGMPVCDRSDQYRTMVHRHAGSLGLVVWWTCSCGAHRVCENENQANVELGAHLALAETESEP